MQEYNSTSQLGDKKFVSLNTGRLCYYEQGEGDVILLLHGWPQTSHVWRKIAPELAQNNRVIALDLPGMGDSDSAEKYDTKYIADILNTFADRLRIDHFHLIGHDIGSWVAAAFALNYESRLKTLTLLDAGIPGLIAPAVFQPANAEKIWQFYFHAIHTVPEFLIENKEREYLSWYFTNKSYVKTAITDQDLELYYQAYKGKDKLKNGFGYYRAFVESTSQNESLLDKKMNLPVIAVGGEFAMGSQVGLGIQKIAMNVNTVSLKFSGHYIPEEQPEELLKILIQHISSK